VHQAKDTTCLWPEAKAIDTERKEVNKPETGSNTSAKCSLATAFFFRAGIRAKIVIFTVAAQRRIYTGLSPLFQSHHDGETSKDTPIILFH
jgi:hypothetical protein